MIIEAGINDGDTVIIRKQDVAETGDIIVALIHDEEATLKRLRKRGSSIALEAANPAYETRALLVRTQVRIQGRLVSLIWGIFILQRWCVWYGRRIIGPYRLCRCWSVGGAVRAFCLRLWVLLPLFYGNCGCQGRGVAGLARACDCGCFRMPVQRPSGAV